MVWELPISVSQVVQGFVRLGSVSLTEHYIRETRRTVWLGNFEDVCRSHEFLSRNHLLSYPFRGYCSPGIMGGQTVR
jgi:hypothetical protein